MSVIETLYLFLTTHNSLYLIKICQTLSFAIVSHVLNRWIWEENRVLKVMCSNPSTVYWMDIFHIYLCVVRIVMFLLKRQK